MNASLRPYIVYDSQTIRETAAVIRENRNRCAIVLGKDRKVIGVCSEGDILNAIIKGVDLHSPLNVLIRPSFHYMTERDMKKAYILLKRHGITLLPIVDEDFHLTGVVTLYEILDDLEQRHGM